jgi:phospholipid/cholesterol/gamma-HCH transport system substrate-binding protein
MMSQTFRLGAFILIGLGALVAGVFLIGTNEAKFQANFRVKAEFQSVSGLVEGADVRVGGVHKGAVRRIDLPRDPDGKVTVTMDLAKETQRIVKADSIVAIRSEGLLGDKYMEVSFGSKDATPLKGGETIRSEPPLDISDLVTKADRILDSANGAMDNIQRTAGNLDAITAKINGGKGTAGALVNDKTMYSEATAGVTALREDADALKHNFFLRGFFKKRGYEDSSDLTRNEIARPPAEPARKVFSCDPKQIFDKPDSAKLKDHKPLDEVGQYLQAEPFGMAVIAASTGMKGDSAQARQLTEARTYVVRKYLVDNFRLEDQRIKTLGLGKSEEPGGKVEIMIYAPGREAADRPAKPTAKPKDGNKP